MSDPATGSVGESERKKLVGMWKLVSASSIAQTGERSETPYGQNPAGYLTYMEDGRMTSLISYGGRKPLSIAGGAEKLKEEQAEAFNTFLAYAGRYSLNGEQLTHHVEISSVQNYVGRDLVRTVKFNGNQITLVTPPTPVNGKIQSVELVWQRVASVM